MIERPVAVADGERVANRAGHVRCARSAASASSWPRARCAATAAANVQPVPCVFRLSMRARAKLENALAVEQQIDDVARPRRARR